MPMKKSKKIEAKNEEPKKSKISLEEFEKKVLELANSGLTTEKIGEILRSQGIHPREHKKISRILREKGKYINPDIKNIEEKIKKIKEHFKKNKQDKRAMRDAERTSAKLRKLKVHFNVSQ